MKVKYCTLLILIVLIFMGCSDEDDFNSPYTYSSESTIYSSTNSTNLRELIVILKPYVEIEGEKMYILVDSIYNVKIEINNNSWGNFNSFEIDTSLFENEIIENKRVTLQEVKYPIIAPYQTPKDTLTLAGEYADLLNETFTLEPGFYVCEVKEFSLRNENTDELVISTTIMEVVEVQENSLSTFIGEFEIKIN